jgi:hypothetical protein
MRRRTLRRHSAATEVLNNGSAIRQLDPFAQEREIIPTWL